MSEAPAAVATTPAAISAPAVAVAAPVAEKPVVAAPVVASESPAAVAAPAADAPVAAGAEPAKPAEAAEAVVAPLVDEPVKPADGEVVPGTEQAKADAPKYADFKMPEGVVADAGVVSAYTNILSKYGIAQEAGQELLDFHADAVRRTQKAAEDHQQDVWAKTNETWRNDFYKSFGNRADTVLNDARAAIAVAFPNAKERAEVWSVLTMTGAGNHKAVINAFARLGKLSREGKAPQAIQSNGGAKNETAAERRYGRS